MPETIFFRWIKTKSPDLEKALDKNPRLVYTENGKPSNKAIWIFEKGTPYTGSRSIQKDRLLVAFEIGKDGTETIKDQQNHIDFEDTTQFKGEAQHRNKIIVKNNEKGAYGVGQEIAGSINTHIKKSRLANKKELAKVLGLSTLEVKEQKESKQSKKK